VSPKQAARLHRILQRQAYNKLGLLKRDNDTLTESPEESFKLLMKEHFPSSQPLQASEPSSPDFDLNKTSDTECSYSQHLFACFERKLSEKLSELEKLKGIDPLIERSLIMIKHFNILSKQLYDFNHQEVKLRWEMFLNRVDEIYIIEYAIADRSDKLPLHLKFWDSHD
jgi:hypothetical protein